jgi:hypothetical protein
VGKKVVLIFWSSILDSFWWVGQITANAKTFWVAVLDSYMYKSKIKTKYR